MKRHYRRYTDEDIINYSKEVKSLAGLIRKCGLKVVGGNYDNMRKNLQRLKVDTSHWTGQAWNKDQQLKNYQDYARASAIKPHLVKARGHSCEICKLSNWMDKPIPLEIHHINKERSDNRYENLQLLCPNCHTQTDNFCKHG